MTLIPVKDSRSCIETAAPPCLFPLFGAQRLFPGACAGDFRPKPGIWAVKAGIGL